MRIGVGSCSPQYYNTHICLCVLILCKLGSVMIVIFFPRLFNSHRKAGKKNCSRSSKTCPRDYGNYCPVDRTGTCPFDRAPPYVPNAPSPQPALEENNNNMRFGLRRPTTTTQTNTTIGRFGEHDLDNRQNY